MEWVETEESRISQWLVSCGLYRQVSNGFDHGLFTDMVSVHFSVKEFTFVEIHFPGKQVSKGYITNFLTKVRSTWPLFA
jgi:hypothetical protein